MPRPSRRFTVRGLPARPHILCGAGSGATDVARSRAWEWVTATVAKDSTVRTWKLGDHPHIMRVVNWPVTGATPMRVWASPDDNAVIVVDNTAHVAVLPLEGDDVAVRNNLKRYDLLKVFEVSESHPWSAALAQSDGSVTILSLDRDASETVLLGKGEESQRMLRFVQGMTLNLAALDNTGALRLWTRRDKDWIAEGDRIVIEEPLLAIESMDSGPFMLAVNHSTALVWSASEAVMKLAHRWNVPCHASRVVMSAGAKWLAAVAPGRCVIHASSCNSDHSIVLSTSCGIVKVALSSDERWLSICDEYSMSLWRLESPDGVWLARTESANDEVPCAMAFDTTGRMAAVALRRTGGEREQTRVVVMDLETDDVKLVAEAYVADGPVDSIMISAGGEWVCVWGRYAGLSLVKID
jgi:hypothetical protein